MKTKFLTTRNMTVMAMLGALAGILMQFQISVPFAPPFYKLDFCEVPTLIGTFTLGPVAGIIISAIKICIDLLLNGTTTGGVGELANFIGCITWVVPAGLIYSRMKTRKGALISLGVSLVTMICGACFVNAFISIPFYAKVMFDGVEQIIAMGTAINANITNMGTFLVFAVVPFNIVKGSLVSVVTFLLYKRVSKLIKNFGVQKAAKSQTES